MKRWIPKSNREIGLGYDDITVDIPRKREGFVVEIEYATAFFKKRCRIKAN